MINPESGVLNPIFTAPSGLESAIISYRNKFGTSALEYNEASERRREDISKLAFTLAVPEVFSVYHSRIPVGAHWADDFDAMSQRYHDVYYLQQTVGFYAGQTMLNFLTGSPGTITDERQTTKVEVLRIIDDPEIVHAIGPAGINYVPDEYQDVPFIRYRVSIPVEAERTLIARAGTKFATRDICKPGQITAFSAVVSVHRDPTIYRATLQKARSTLLFGDDAVNQVIDHLRQPESVRPMSDIDVLLSENAALMRTISLS